MDEEGYVELHDLVFLTFDLLTSKVAFSGSMFPEIKVKVAFS